ncbi:MAG: hypothetical protein JWR80_1928 [Bradyrhizobium sp.]|nr:hypothetical protein [Bradyrhizobium sp.]
MKPGGFRYWHFSDMAVGLRNVRYLGASGLPGCEFGLPSLTYCGRRPLKHMCVCTLSALPLRYCFQAGRQI